MLGSFGGAARWAMERHDVTSGSRYVWRGKPKAGMLLDRSVRALPSATEAPSGGGFAEGIIADPVVPALPATRPPPAPDIASRIAIEVPGGNRLSVDESIEAEALGRVLSVLQR